MVASLIAAALTAAVPAATGAAITAGTQELISQDGSNAPDKPRAAPGAPRSPNKAQTSRRRAGGARAAVGRDSTILTGPLGLLDAAPTGGRRSLLGG